VSFPAVVFKDKRLAKVKKKESEKGAEEQRKLQAFRSRKAQRRDRQRMKSKGKKKYLSWNVRAAQINE
jgi:hypothetical protein